MTRKHFEAIAASIAEAHRTYKPSRGEAHVAIDDVARNLAATLGRFNPAFNRDKFLKACGVERKG